MITVNNLSVSYPGKIEALQDISLSLPGGGITGIIGPNGAGKSTLMKAILGLINYSGQVKIDTADANSKATAIAYVEQRSSIDLNFPITVSECVLLGTYGKLGFFKKISKEDREKVSHYLEKVGLLEFEHRPIKSLSGGQFQRMLLARCLIQEKDYLFLDEPFAGIDSLSESIIIDLLKKLASKGKTILIVHHDLSKVDYYFDRVILLNKKLVTYGKVTDVFNPKYLEEAYGHMMVGEAL